MNISPKITESEEHNILSTYLANPEKTDATLERLQERVSSALPDNDKLEGHLRKSWNSILHLASQQPHSSNQQDSLVKLLQALITQTPPLKDTNGKEVEVDGSKVWSGLPLFGQQARECWNFPDDKEVDIKTRDTWINVNAFVARLTAAAVNDHGGERQYYNALDFSLYGVWSLRSALEEDLSNLPAKITADASIGAAAVWILYAGPTLKGLSDSDKTYSGKVARPGFKCKDQEWRGYTKDRWQMWTKELAQVKDLVQDSSIRELVENALKVMKH
ncbi:hypothetical protein E4T44_08269 [Aureobasidium sp. EXF-8845]|nr:hypothetical protein E4T44_08269 [Aureobasidium sp. EXF-8845]KAI4844372.1 hypothetical protein E4T45_08186 [Aureobasidium sp. EXF-8846]